MTEQIDWNEASKRGLIERINTEVLHPIGLAMFRVPDTGVSPGLLIADDGVWEYAKGTTAIEQRDALRKALECLILHTKPGKGNAIALNHAHQVLETL